jgi:hypothetical protein
MVPWAGCDEYSSARRFLRPITATGLLLIGCLLASCEATQAVSGDAARTASAEATSIGAPATIIVARRRWHIDIGFATADLGEPLDSVAATLPGVKYLFFGFGDRHYLMAKRKNAPAMLGAVFPGPGIILVTGLKHTPAEAFGAGQVIELAVSPGQTRAIQAFIWDSLTHVTGQPITPYARGPYEGSLYFSSAVRYSAFHTCNTWAAEALRAAALPIRSGAILFAWQLWPQVEKLRGIRAPLRSNLNRREAVFHSGKQP